MFVVFDLDGTLADCTHRQHFVDKTQGKPDWRAFFAACDGDVPHWHIISILLALDANEHYIEIWSGRSNEVRDKTEAWLAAHGLGGILLRMRREHDYTPDDELKRSWLDPFNKPDLVFDDRDKVVRMWRENGIPCCQVAEGNF